MNKPISSALPPSTSNPYLANSLTPPPHAPSTSFLPTFAASWHMVNAVPPLTERGRALEDEHLGYGTCMVTQRPKVWPSMGRSLIDPEGHRWRYTECWTGWGHPSGWKVLGHAEHFLAPGALEGADLLVSPLRLGHPRQDGTARVTPLANPSWGWEVGGRGRLASDRPLGVTHSCTAEHGAVLALVDASRLEGCAHTWRIPKHARGKLTAV